MVLLQSNYIDEFKRDAVQMLIFSSKPPAQIERDWGIESGLLLTWQKQLEKAYPIAKKSRRSFIEDHEPPSSATSLSLLSACSKG